MEDQSKSVVLSVVAVIAGIALFLLTAGLLFTTLGVAAMLPASLLGASAIAIIFPSKSIPVAVSFLVPTAVAYIILPMGAAAMTDGHPGNIMMWQWAVIPHIVLSLATLKIVRILPSPKLRLLAPVFILAATAATAFGFHFAADRQWRALMERTKSAVPAAFERDLLPHLLATPQKVSWSKPVAVDEPTSQLPKYAIGGVAKGDTHIQLSGFSAYSVSFTVTIPAADFKLPDLKDPSRVKRAQEWLRAAGVSSEQLQDLQIGVMEHWGNWHNSSERIVSIRPGKRQVTIEGIAGYDPVAKSFRG